MKARVYVLACLSAVAALAGSKWAYAFEGVPGDWQVDLSPAASPVMESMRSFNMLLLVIISAIVAFVLGLLLWVIFRYRESVHPVPSRLSHNTALEMLWTILPVLVLVVIAIPSFRLLFYQFDFPKADVVGKATGRQWSWSYEYPDEKISFDSFPIDDKDLKPGQPRALAVDNEVVVPVNKVVQVLITGGDVIHQWVVPAFGSRADAIPGRVNRTWFIAKETGTYYGQCSALCGQGHPYMPVAVKVVSGEDYAKWLATRKQAANAQDGRTALAAPDSARKRLGEIPNNAGELR